MTAAPDSASPIAQPPRIPLTRLPGFVSFLSGRGLSALANQMQAVAVGWQIYALTHKALSLGLVGLAQFLPLTLLVFVAGHAVDHFDRKVIAAGAQIISAIGAFVLMAGSIEHWLSPLAIYLIVALFGVARAFEMPASQTFLPSLVTAEDFPRAAAVSSSLFQAAVIIGPSAGGLMYGLGAPVVYAVCGLGFLLAALSTLTLRLTRNVRPRGPVTLGAVFGGIVFLRSQPAILGAISLDLFAVLLGGATAMLPLYATDILHAGPLALGLLRGAPAVGALAMSMWLARHPLGDRAGRTMFASVAVFGVATILFGLSHSILISVAMLAVLGAADVISVMIRGALVQLGTPDEMRGRVSAVNMLFIGSSNQLGEFESGTLASLIGPVEAVVFGGIGTLVVTGLWMWMFPDLRRLNRLDQITAPEIDARGRAIHPA
ncbi:major facilitator superfamily transporter [Ameyamaea chiangmaiensis NBRC 103196]|uniref:MFS transporter n=1 Tax=Ameyamaea chiangmaiensis TaxID=442969 RepID=A0A850PEY7_9PROT|nr:MFS transporter [Ameyamaea chiangmaiensis]MBS4076002.1 MFS transporter [Ameyamaea chiangmaiensis]NVN40816.1 MFS transporter [Ameyamaea chiangmaiensis]GBQ61493.1 major facilitator superfamily transporter [Ameyamaea chiangmaiensis NBRC 103196]